MPDAPLISVLMPVYNAARYLPEAIQSVLAQTFTDFEFIIIDDGSTDASASILDALAKQDHRVRVVRRPNTGIIGALNDGLAVARGELIARMDADDLSMPDRFAKQVAYLLEHPAVVAVGGRVRWMDGDGAAIMDPPVLVHHAQIDEQHMNGVGGGMSHPAAMMRSSAIKSVGGYHDYRHAEDLDLFLRLAEIGELANLPDVVLQWRIHPASIGQTHNTVQRESARRAVRDAHARRGLLPPPWKREMASGDDFSFPSQHTRWAWWALSGGNVATSRKHALKALRGAPLRSESWKVVLCSLRGH